MPCTLLLTLFNILLSVFLEGMDKIFELILRYKPSNDYQIIICCYEKSCCVHKINHNLSRLMDLSWFGSHRFY